MTRGPEAAADGARPAGDTHWAGEPVPVLERQWGIPLLEAHARLGSTNDRLRELARRGAPPFTVVVAEEQTAGRGRGGSRWLSPHGMGIWMSVLLPGDPGRGAPLTPLLVGLAVVRAIHVRYPGVRADIKWPNDVLVDGRKVCGILCEGAPEGCTIAGVGINVRGDDPDLPEGLRSHATTLEAAVGARIARPDLAGAVLRRLRELTDPSTDELTGELVRELEVLDALRGRMLAASSGVVGLGAGIDRSGALLVDPGDGAPLERVVAGTVRRLEET